MRRLKGVVTNGKVIVDLNLDSVVISDFTTKGQVAANDILEQAVVLLCSEKMRGKGKGIDCSKLFKRS